MPRSLRRAVPSSVLVTPGIELDGFVERVAVERPDVLDGDRVVRQCRRRAASPMTVMSALSLPSSNTLSWRDGDVAAAHEERRHG